MTKESNLLEALSTRAKLHYGYNLGIFNIIWIRHNWDARVFNIWHFGVINKKIIEKHWSYENLKASIIVNVVYIITTGVKIFND